MSREISIPDDSFLLIDLRSRAKSLVPTISVFEVQTPRAARRQYELAQENIRKGDCDRGLQHLAEAIRIFSKYADAYNAIGKCHVQRSQPNLAEDAFNNAIAFTASVFPALNLA